MTLEVQVVVEGAPLSCCGVACGVVHIHNMWMGEVARGLEG